MSSITFQPTSFDSDFAHIIDGKKVASDRFRDVINPANKQPIASVPIATREQLDQAVDAAAKAFKTWSKVPVEERQATVKKLGRIFEQFDKELTVLHTKEQGQPPKFLAMLGSNASWWDALTSQTLPDVVTVDTPERIIITRHTPLGVCAAIVPWNAPIFLMLWKIAPALITGNTIIVKPSPYTPLSNLKFVELAQQVLPPGVLSVLSGDDNLGPWITSHPGIAKIAFTGSTATGKLVMKSASATIKRVTLELGGNDAAIILPDVDAKALAPNLIWASCGLTGQVCAAAKRLYVHEDVYDSIRDEMVKFARTIKVGNGLDPETDLGPIQNEMQYNKVKRYIADAKAQGLNFVLGGEVDDNAPGYFVPISIIDNPPENSNIVVEEPFGPIVPLLKWRDETDVIRRANNTDYGLSATVWSKDLDRAEKIAQQLEAGTVWINEWMHLNPQTPFGGHKMSGIGVESSVDALKGWTNVSVVSKNRVAAV